MKSKKVTMLAAALVVAVVALAGVGYAAATSYKATTVNDSNTANAEYILAKQTTYTSSFDDDVDFYTYTDSTFNQDGDATHKPVYSIIGSQALKNGTTDTGKVGKAIGTSTITVEKTSGITATNYKVTAKVYANGQSSANLPDGWSYYIGYNVADDSGVLTGTFAALTKDATTGVYSTTGVTVTPNANNQVTVGLYIAGTDFNTVTEIATGIFDGYDGLGSSSSYAPATNGKLFVGANVAFTFDTQTA